MLPILAGCSYQQFPVGVALRLYLFKGWSAKSGLANLATR